MKGCITSRGCVAAAATATVTLAGLFGAMSAQAKQQYTVALASEGLTAPFPIGIANGAKAVAAKDGIKLLVLDGKLSETTQETDVQTAIAEHVNGLIIDVIDPGPTAAMVKEANAAHIPVMLVHGYAGNTVKPAYKGVAYEVDENEVQGGKDAGPLALKADPKGGQIAVITGTPGYNAVPQRQDGFLSVLKPTKKYTVVATQSGGWTATGGYTACQSILQAHPKLAMFFTESDDMAIGCAKALKAANSKIPIVSTGGGETEVKGLIKSGQVYGTVCYEPKTEGGLVMTAMANEITGKKKYNGQVDFYKTPAVTLKNISGCGWQW